MTTYRFLVVVEDAGANFSAYSPDLPGCVATGSTRDEAEQNMAEAESFSALRDPAVPIDRTANLGR
jgi:hypothetical protein